MRKPLPGWMVLAPALMLLTACCVPFSWFARQRQAIARIEALGGRVQTTQGAPDWLRGIAGHRLARVFDRATVVNLSETPTTDVDLAVLHDLWGIERLSLAGTRVSDAGMPAIAHLSQLKALDLNRTAVSDAGLARLTALTRLEYLYLDGTRVTAAGRQAYREALASPD